MKEPRDTASAIDIASDALRKLGLRKDTATKSEERVFVGADPLADFRAEVACGGDDGAEVLVLREHTKHLPREEGQPIAIILELHEAKSFLHTIPPKGKNTFGLAREVVDPKAKLTTR